MTAASVATARVEKSARPRKKTRRRRIDFIVRWGIAMPIRYRWSPGTATGRLDILAETGRAEFRALCARREEVPSGIPACAPLVAYPPRFSRFERSPHELHKTSGIRR